jgi:hypothetical protein
MTDADDSTEMLAILAGYGLTPLEEDLPLLKANYEQALEQKALVHGVAGARHEEPLLVARARG